MIKLLPFKYKIVGFFCLSIAAILAFVYFIYGLRISMPVLAVYSSYLETKMFATFKTNIADEIIMLLFVAGFFLIAWSKERVERKGLKLLRIKAIQKSIIAYTIWIVFSIVFIFGNGFISVLVLNLITPFIIYLIFFYGQKTGELKRRRLQKLQKKIEKALQKI